MTLSSNNPPRRTMKSRIGFSNAGRDGSIPASVSRSTRSMKAILALAAMSLALFALPGPAFAAESCDNAQSDATAGQYCNPVESLEAGLGAGGGQPGGQPAEQVAVPVEESGPSLPFTGLDVAALVAVALALTGTGIVLRRLATIGDTEK
jgi:hypothetical protein